MSTLDVLFFYIAVHIFLTLIAAIVYSTAYRKNLVSEIFDLYLNYISGIPAMHLQLLKPIFFSITFLYGVSEANAMIGTIYYFEIMSLLKV